MFPPKNRVEDFIVELIHSPNIKRPLRNHGLVGNFHLIETIFYFVFSGDGLFQIKPDIHLNEARTDFWLLNLPESTTKQKGMHLSMWRLPPSCHVSG
jgi:hypothetical protein